MFAKFKLDGINANTFSTYYDHGLKFYQNCEHAAREQFPGFIDERGVIDGTKLQDSWFPVDDSYHVFLSHSHGNEKAAVGLAGFLHKELGLNTFIDSCLWGYSDTLLWNLDKAYCLDDDQRLFSYKSRNHSTSHVHMMLSIALMRMINACEAVIFLNTPEAISMKQDIDQQRTGSAWIYNELSMANLIQVRSPGEHRTWLPLLEHAAFESLQIDYRVTELLKDFLPLSESDLWECCLKCDARPQLALDYIYRQKGLILPA